MLSSFFGNKKSTDQSMNQKALDDPNLYIAIDIETDGDSIYDNSMLNLGAVAFTPDRTEVGSFTVNLKPRAGATQKPDTMEWWLNKNKAVWDEITQNQQEIHVAMIAFRDWITKMQGEHAPKGKVIFLCYPTGFDGAYVSAYWMKVFNGVGLNKVGFAFDFLDIKSYAAGKFGCTYAEAGSASKKYVPDPKQFPHTHKGEDDARKQGLMWFNIRDA